VADEVFSAARLRGYRVLEEAGLGDAVELQIVDRVIAGRLWLPFSLVELAFRNAVDRAVTAAHELGPDWLISEGKDGASLVAAAVKGPAVLCRPRDDGTDHDPIADAARMAADQLNRERISRDDLVAHLMFGFWVHRCGLGLGAQEPALDVWELTAAEFRAPLEDPEYLRKLMGRLLRIRNRVAHHEPLVFRAKHLLRRDGSPKNAAELVMSLEGAIPAFLAEVDLAVETAIVMAPMAARFLEEVPDQIRADVGQLQAAVAAERRRLREARDARLAAREAERDKRLQGDSET
jgi:hypothetical protein